MRTHAPKHKFFEYDDNKSYAIWKETVKQVKSADPVKNMDHRPENNSLYQNTYKYSDKVERDNTQTNRFEIHPPVKQSAAMFEPTRGRGYFPDQVKATLPKKEPFKDKIYLHQKG